MIGPPPHSGSASKALSASLRALSRHFHRQTPIRGGSLLITIFGDSIAPRGGAVTLGSLIDLAQPFGLAERLVRTSVARLARDGWLIAHRKGRRSEYRLTATGQQRFAEATRRIYGEMPRSWDGQWTLLVLPPGSPRRQDLRHELRWRGFGQVSPGVFAHPSSSIESARADLIGLEGTAQALLFKTSTEDSDADRRLIALGWDLGDLARRYRKFLDTFTPVAEAATACAPAGLDTTAAFVIRTLLIHEYRKIHLRDPLLPPALLPADWIGAAAYELSKRLYSVVFQTAERHLSNTTTTLDGPLPEANCAAFTRFGGLDSPI